MSQDIGKREHMFDNRVVQRNIRQGRIVRDEFEQYLSSLPDLKEFCEDIGEEIYGGERTGVALTGDYLGDQEDDDA